MKKRLFISLLILSLCAVSYGKITLVGDWSLNGEGSSKFTDNLLKFESQDGDEETGYDVAGFIDWDADNSDYKCREYFIGTLDGFHLEFEGDRIENGTGNLFHYTATVDPDSSKMVGTWEALEGETTPPATWEATIPEPCTFLLLALGSVMLRRRKS